jgi:squalene synthase HpnC
VLTAQLKRPPAEAAAGAGAMADETATRSGKTHRTENFPVASRLVRPEHRPLIMAFYDFARAADDIADDSAFSPQEKIRRLDAMEAGLMGEGDHPLGLALRAALKTRGLSGRHARDLLIAFRADATKLRYADWWELMGYCAYSANPVGRFVLDVHGEDERVWPASDAICSALQIINHLQDCADDYKTINRVYIPQDRLAAHGAPVEALGAPRASRELRAVIVELTERTRGLLREGRTLAGDVADRRLRLEIQVIYALAEAHIDRLLVMDPLSQRAKLPRWGMGWVAARAAVGGLLYGAPRSARAAEARS